MSTGKTKASEGVHRLNNILVEEVSVVDRAANKRRFLLVKREDVDMTELRPNGRGGFTKVEKADAEGKPSTDEQEEDTAKAGKPFPGAAQPFGSKPDDDEDDDEEGKGPKKKKLKAEDTKKDAAAGVSLVDELTGCIEQLIGVASAMKVPTTAAEPPAAEAMAASAAKVLQSLGEVHKRLGLAIEKNSPTTAAEVTKAGRKMSKERLTAFSGAMEVLGKLLAELMSSNEPDTAALAEKRAESQKSEKLAKAMTELVAITKAQQREIEALKKGVSAPNSTPVEKGTRKRSESNAADEVSWPLDMNRPLSDDDKD